jgi:hypothetical protein
MGGDIAHHPYKQICWLMDSCYMPCYPSFCCMKIVIQNHPGSTKWQAYPRLAREESGSRDIHTYLEVLRREGSFFSVLFSHLESVCCNLQAVHSPDNRSNLEMAIVVLFLAYAHTHTHPYMHTYTCIWRTLFVIRYVNCNKSICSNCCKHHLNCTYMYIHAHHFLIFWFYSQVLLVLAERVVEHYQVLFVNE